MNRISFCILLFFCCCTTTVCAEDRKPNLVVIFADDLGFGDISCYHAQGTKTPVINKMAAEGFRSTDFFLPANVCSPCGTVIGNCICLVQSRISRFGPRTRNILLRASSH